jgi:hypothetical protein
MDAPAPSQAEKFKQATGDLDCDENEGCWDERLRKVSGQKPVEKPE